MRKEFDPGGFRREPEHLLEDEEDADNRHPEDHPVERRIGHEGIGQRNEQDAGDHQHRDEEDDHADQIASRIGHEAIRPFLRRPSGRGPVACGAGLIG
ncbi:MAG: hypothetical protein ACMVO3_23560 [Thalassobaculum sp.]